MNATLNKFGYPRTLVADYTHWCVLLRPAQPTLGALVLGAKSEATSFAQLEPQAYAELATITSQIERGLAAFRRFDRINYLMLMMVDPHVHFHVLPRYESPQNFGTRDYADKGWPGPPDLKAAMLPTPEEEKAIVAKLRSVWPKD